MPDPRSVWSRGTLEEKTHGLPDGPTARPIRLLPYVLDFDVGLILSAKLGGGSEPGKSGAPCFLLRDTIQPVHGSSDVDGGGSHYMLQASFG
jgi:hypothetical protein